MTTAGGWLAIVADVLLPRAAAALVSAQKIQQWMLKSERCAVSRECRQPAELRSKITSSSPVGSALRPCQEGWMPRRSVPRQLRRLETLSAQPASDPMDVFTPGARAGKGPLSLRSASTPFGSSNWRTLGQIEACGQGLTWRARRALSELQMPTPKKLKEQLQIPRSFWIPRLQGSGDLSLDHRLQLPSNLSHSGLFIGSHSP